MYLSNVRDDPVRHSSATQNRHSSNQSIFPCLSSTHLPLQKPADNLYTCQMGDELKSLPVEPMLK